MVEITHIPQTAAEMVSFLVKTGITRAYCDIRAAAKNGKLSESEIGDVERLVLIEIAKVRIAAVEFPSFDIDTAIWEAEGLLIQFFSAARGSSGGNP